MSELTIVQKFCLIALNAQDSIHMTAAKKCALKCAAAAVVLERCIKAGITDFSSQVRLPEADAETPYYQEIVVNALHLGSGQQAYNLDQWIKKAAMISGKYMKELERAAADSLKALKLMEEAPDLLGCDLNYQTAGISMKEYRSDEEAYDRITERLKSLTDEECRPEPEELALVWLLGESGCLSDLYTKDELKQIRLQINRWFREDIFARELFRIHIQKSTDSAVKNALDVKKRIMSTQVGTGVNYTFPFIERSQSVFIETEAWMANPQQRLWDAVARLEQNGHKVKVMTEGEARVLKIDNLLYEAVPTAVRAETAVTGVRLRRHRV